MALKNFAVKYKKSGKFEENFYAFVFVYFYYCIKKNFTNIINSNIFAEIVDTQLDNEINILKIATVMFAVFLIC